MAAELRLRDVSVELVLVTTRGDRDQSQAIDALGGDGLFTKELERSLLVGEIDVAVHSLKDLPTEPVPGLILAAVPARGPAGDVLVSRRSDSRCAVAWRGRRHRQHAAARQLLHARPDLVMQDIRGNVDTRLRKLQAGDYDALVLAEAGLQRLGLEREITQRLPPSVLLSAVGQGAGPGVSRSGPRDSRDTRGARSRGDARGGRGRAVDAPRPARRLPCAGGWLGPR